MHCVNNIKAIAYHDDRFEEHHEMAQLGWPFEEGQTCGDVVKATSRAKGVQVVHHEHGYPAHALVCVMEK
jgi:hypothetical protein